VACKILSTSVVLPWSIFSEGVLFGQTSGEGTEFKRGQQTKEAINAGLTSLKQGFILVLSKLPV
jgi:hypothetical protein